LQPVLAILFQTPAQQFVYTRWRGGDVGVFIQDAAQYLYGGIARE
jgi:hypothetical protein